MTPSNTGLVTGIVTYGLMLAVRDSALTPPGTRQTAQPPSSPSAPSAESAGATAEAAPRTPVSAAAQVVVQICNA